VGLWAGRLLVEDKLVVDAVEDRPAREGDVGPLGPLGLVGVEAEREAVWPVIVAVEKGCKDSQQVLLDAVNGPHFEVSQTRALDHHQLQNPYVQRGEQCCGEKMKTKSS